MMTVNLREKIAYKQNIRLYLQELTQLSKEVPVETSLQSLETTNAIRGLAMKNLHGKQCVKHTIRFEEKMSKHFGEFVKSLYQSNSSHVYIWTNLSNICGVLEIESILDFNFGFSFDVNPDGVIALLTKDLLDKLILDFYVDATGNKILDMELCGDTWPLVIY